MFSSLSVGNKKWLADHLYTDIRQSQDVRSKEQLALDMEMSLLETMALVSYARWKELRYMTDYKEV